MIDYLLIILKIVIIICQSFEIEDVLIVMGNIYGTFLIIIYYQLTGISLIIDFTIYKPYCNKKICISYGFLSCVFEYTLILLTLIKYTSIVSSNKIFYTWMIIWPLLNNAANIIWNSKYIYCLKILLVTELFWKYRKKMKRLDIF